ncbi:lambda-crystallin-like [Panulirus ornatus]|uniref:lambda-crystallin-like n=1 Tax=Panulirus ornatus TaxID=150431 RepID=UPI003A86942D
MARQEKIGIVGSGFIGRSWAMLFASSGYEVSIYDVKPEQVSAALEDIMQHLRSLEKSGMLRGTTLASEQHKCIKGASSLKDCVEGAKLVQESVFEDEELKKEVLSEIDQLADPDTILSSSTSCIVPSKLSAHLTHKANFIVCHPVNPPYYVPLVEVVPAPWTSKDVIARAGALMKEIGQSPVIFSKELPGFGLNRLQYALLNECNNLLQSGILSAEGIDTLIKDGFGYRCAFMGPFEISALNAHGIEDFIKRYGPTVASVTKTFAKPPSWIPEESGTLIEQVNELIPKEKLMERRQWRDMRLAALAKLKKELKEQEASEK